MFFRSAVFCILLIAGCTENPFDGDDISGGNRQVRGKVVLGDQQNLKDIFVWLEGFNIGSRTDENGNFQVTLPPPSGQASSGGLDGIFNLFFYVANYKLESSDVVVQDGQFVYSKGDINQDGELKEAKSLSQFLSIKTEVAPNPVIRTSTDLVGVTVRLKAVFVDSVTVIFPRSTGGFLGAALLRNVETGAVFIVEPVPGGIDDPVLVGQSEVSRNLIFSLTNNPLPAGKYAVFPYLLIRHEHIPAELMASLGNNVEDLSPNYLNIPFKRDDPILEVR